MKVIIRERLGDDYYTGNPRIVHIAENVSVAWVRNEGKTILITTRQRCQVEATDNMVCLT